MRLEVETENSPTEVNNTSEVWRQYRRRPTHHVTYIWNRRKLMKNIQCNICIGNWTWVTLPVNSIDCKLRHGTVDQCPHLQVSMNANIPSFSERKSITDYTLQKFRAFLIQSNFWGSDWIEFFFIKRECFTQDKIFWTCHFSFGPYLTIVNETVLGREGKQVGSVTAYAVLQDRPFIEALSVFFISNS